MPFFKCLCLSAFHVGGSFGIFVGSLHLVKIAMSWSLEEVLVMSGLSANSWSMFFWKVREARWAACGPGSNMDVSEAVESEKIQNPHVWLPKHCFMDKFGSMCECHHLGVIVACLLDEGGPCV